VNTLKLFAGMTRQPAPLPDAEADADAAAEDLEVLELEDVESEVDFELEDPVLEAIALVEVGRVAEYA
jgi:hypothetical protein